MHGSGSGSSDPRRPDKEHRYKPPPPTAQAAPGEDLTPDYMKHLGHDIQHVWPDDETEMVCLGGIVLFLYQLCQLTSK